MKKVKYRINGQFGLNNIGDVVDAYLIVDDEPYGLLYHPWEKGLCPSFEIAIFDDKTNCWTSQKGFNKKKLPFSCSDQGTYVNVIEKPLVLEKQLMKLLK